MLRGSDAALGCARKLLPRLRAEAPVLLSRGFRVACRLARAPYNSWHARALVVGTAAAASASTFLWRERPVDDGSTRPARCHASGKGVPCLDGGCGSPELREFLVLGPEVAQLARTAQLLQALLVPWAVCCQSRCTFAGFEPEWSDSCTGPLSCLLWARTTPVPAEASRCLSLSISKCT